MKNGLISLCATASSALYVTPLCVYLGMTMGNLEEKSENISLKKSVLNRYIFWLKRTSKLTLSCSMMAALYMAVLASVQYDTVCKLDDERNLNSEEFVNENIFI